MFAGSRLLLPVPINFITMCNLSYIINLTFMYKLNRCYIKLSLVNILEMVFVFIEILFKIVLFKGGVLIYAEHCITMS